MPRDGQMQFDFNALPAVVAPKLRADGRPEPVPEPGGGFSLPCPGCGTKIVREYRSSFRKNFFCSKGCGKNRPPAIEQRFGKLVVEGPAERNRNGRTQSICRCDCGTTGFIVLNNSLNVGHTTSCGCAVADAALERSPDLTGQRFGRWVVERRAAPDEHTRPAWHCRCKCEKTKIVAAVFLLNGESTSCGCYHRSIAGEAKVVDLMGQRFGRLLVVGRLGKALAKSVLWVCRCNCGSPDKAISSVELIHGGTESCGCLRSEGLSERNTTHGMSSTTEYRIWCNMLSRCTNPNDAAYPDYGGRGIRVCERWMTFENFYADVGNRPKDRSLDRIDNDGNYQPGNWRWATDKEQANNQRPRRPRGSPSTRQPPAERRPDQRRIRDEDMVGQTFGSLTVTGRAPRDRYKSDYWLCQCACKSPIKAVKGDHLRRGATKTCGCAQAATNRRLRRTHGMTGTPTYTTWATMLSRCNNPNFPNYAKYGAKGVTVCERWHTFANFFADMGERPVGMTLDRIDGTLGYQPGNCKWATSIEQGNNQSTNRMIECRGETRSLAQWGRLTGIARVTIASRLDRLGWSVAEALGYEKRTAKTKAK